MDNLTSKWIIEFLLRPRIDDSILNRFLAVVPLDNDDSRLKKALLLRRIQTEVTNATVSEKILELLELFGELEFREGKAHSESMKAAYCAVAVDCTVRFLGGLGLRNNEKYLEILKKLWRGRIRKMEKSENPGLSSEKLRSWREDLEAASSNSELRGKMLSMNTRNEALKAVKVFLAESWNEMGSSFVEKTAEDVVKMGKVGHGINEAGEDQGFECSEDVIMPHVSSPTDRPPVEKTPEDVVKMGKFGHEINEAGEEQGFECSEDVIMPHVETSPTDKPPVETQQEQGLPKYPHAGGGRVSSRKVRIINIEEVVVDIDTSTNKYDPIPASVVEKAKADLLSSFADLRAVVKDPLPDAMKVAERVVSDMDRDRGLGGNNGGAMHEASTSMDKRERTRLGANRVESVGGSDEHPEREDCRNGRDPSPTDLNPGSDTDSFEFSEELPRRPALSSPKRRKISPLKKYQMKKLSKRRPPKKWSVLEEDTLRNGVQEFGRSWTTILDAHRDVFEERTASDLKDKWRNMTRLSR